MGDLEKKGKALEAAAKSTKFTRYPTGFDDVAKYIKEHKKLPDNYITKEQAKALGWDKKAGNLHKVAPGKSMGGDIFENKEGLLPNAPGRTWYEADVNYLSGYRGNDRILYSNDGLVYKTSDHYKTLTEIK
ncbi:ribonuclease domain-containing protein [Bacillus pseudomycoides]|uniref:ribonuclease domain-containing protein n=1 Tax=Bacillus TaxID=1386 RepID=UPI0039FC7EE2